MFILKMKHLKGYFGKKIQFNGTSSKKIPKYGEVSNLDCFIEL